MAKQPTPAGLARPLPMEVPVTDPEDILQIGVFYGLRLALAELEGAAWGGKLAGMELARTLLRAASDREALKAMRKANKIAAKAGADLSQDHEMRFKGAAIELRPWAGEAPELEAGEGEGSDDA